MKTAHGAVPIAYDDAGAGSPALLCLPGWCAERSAFAPLLRDCAAHRRVMALDWRGHGGSGAATTEFGTAELVDDAEAVIRDSGAEAVIPVALAHSGWVAIELRRRLGVRVPAIVLVDWLVLDPPPPFLGALKALQDPATWDATRDRLFGMWLEGVDNAEVTHLVRTVMARYPAEMWGRGGREIAAAYDRAGNPLKALAALSPAVPVLHLYAQPEDPNFLAAQQAFAADNPWFRVVKVDARSHFPMLEAPDAMAEGIERFLKGAL